MRFNGPSADGDGDPKLTQRVKTFYVESWPELRLNKGVWEREREMCNKLHNYKYNKILFSSAKKCEWNHFEITQDNKSKYLLLTSIFCLSVLWSTLSTDLFVFYIKNIRFVSNSNKNWILNSETHLTPNIHRLKIAKS